MHVSHANTNSPIHCLFIFVHPSIHSIGEVGSRVRPGSDNTLHTTLGTETQQLLSTGGSGDALSSLPITATPQASGTTEGKDSENREKQSPEMVDVELEEADIGHNQSTSTLVNEDSLPTPMQSSNSITPLTLTEISQVEGAQSTLQLKVDERAQVEEPLATAEATSELLANEKAAVGDGNSVDGIGDGMKREKRRIGVDSHQSSEQDTNLIIGDIVRSEMRKILEVHVCTPYYTYCTMQCSVHTCTCT